MIDTSTNKTTRTVETTAFADIRQPPVPETILLVEDEVFVRKVAADVLESAGYRVLIARNSAEALALFRARSELVDLLLSDIVMPGMSGSELAAEFQNLCPSVRILLMSGHGGQLVSSDPLFRGENYLAKPFSVRMLLKSVRHALDSRPGKLRRAL